MTDTWERRAIANTPGYNNLGPALTFTPVYDQGTDTLVITASHPVLGAVDQINFQGTNGNGTLIVGGDFIVDSPTQITVSGAYAALLGPPDLTLTQLDFFNFGPVLVGTWTGSVAVVAPAPAIDVVTYGTVYNDTVQSPFVCADAATAVPISAIFFYTSNLLAAAGIRVQTTAGDLDFRQDLVPSDWYSWADGFAVLAANALDGRRVTGAVPIDSGNLPIGSPTVLDFEFFAVDSAGIISGGLDDTLRVDLTTGANDTVPASVTVEQCTVANLINYYDPLGPLSGLNPGTATIIQWDIDAIIVQDTQLPADDVSLISVLNETGSGYQRMGDPIPQVAP
jgi:hypothetical protein